MLVIMATAVSWVTVNSIVTLHFSLSFSILVFGFVASIVSGYSNMVGFSFVRLYGRVDVLRSLLIRLTV